MPTKRANTVRQFIVASGSSAQPIPPASSVSMHLVSTAVDIHCLMYIAKNVGVCTCTFASPYFKLPGSRYI